MGVPLFFRWLSGKFPKIVSQVVEEKQRRVNGKAIPVDTTKPNPNGEEFDNLYLDMNSIIHPCCHPTHKPAPATEDDMIIGILEYIDRIVDIVRPRQVLYMAIDGVAPRAKMNLQRSRRFLTGRKVENQAINQARFDSNCITPGTPFMAHLATCLRYHITRKQSTDPLWKNLKVILSDATVPGEGEHKIMEYIRVQRALPAHNPNTSHVLYGLDADLIMLALGTHEPRFKILHEGDVFINKKGECRACQKQGHHAKQCNATLNELAAARDAKIADAAKPKPFVFIHVNVLREYLAHALKFNIQGIPWDLERAIDDWVFMCFLVGNDFLPCLPSLEIREGAIGTLSLLWKQIMPIMGGYMTDDLDVDFERVQLLVSELGKKEDTIFSERRKNEILCKQNALEGRWVKNAWNSPQSYGFSRERDAVMLGEKGWKERYYQSKFGIKLSDTESIRDIVQSYCKGLAWVFKYYYMGCVSWSWYYPYYYAPMASDFVHVENVDVKFDKGAPLRPFEQLMSVLPAASRAHIPRPFHALMTEASSPIIDFYPTDFQVDLNGQKWEWQGVSKLPFIETPRLLAAMGTVYDQLNYEEKMRNSEGKSILFVQERHMLYDSIAAVYTERATNRPLTIDAKLSAGMTGTVNKCPGYIPRKTLRSPLPNHDGMPDIANSRSICVAYFLPSLPDTFKFTTALLRGVKLQKTVLLFTDRHTATFENTNGEHCIRNTYGHNQGQQYQGGGGWRSNGYGGGYTSGSRGGRGYYSRGSYY